MIRFEIEVTDTFGGESNYSWVHRYEIEVPEGLSTRAIARRIKAEAGYAGIPGRSYWHGLDEYEFRPYGVCHVLFARYVD